MNSGRRGHCNLPHIACSVSLQGAAGYWTSWGPEEARDSPEVKGFLGLEPEDRCIGVFLMGVADSERVATYRVKRGPIGEKVEWRV